MFNNSFRNDDLTNFRAITTTLFHKEMIHSMRFSLYNFVFYQLQKQRSILCHCSHSSERKKKKKNKITFKISTNKYHSLNSPLPLLEFSPIELFNCSINKTTNRKQLQISIANKNKQTNKQNKPTSINKRQNTILKTIHNTRHTHKETLHQWSRKFLRPCVKSYSSCSTHQIFL